MLERFENHNVHDLQSEVTLNTLPVEILFKIFEYLPVEDLGKSREISSQIKIIAEDDKFWKIKFVKLGLNKVELDLVETNGGYKNSFYKMREMLSNQFDPTQYNTENDSLGINALLFVISRTIIQSRSTCCFFSNFPLDDELIKITKSNVLALNFLLRQSDLLNFLSLANLAAHNLDYAKIILEDNSNVVIDVLNRNELSITWNLPIAWRLPGFLTRIVEIAECSNEYSNEYNDYVENFNSSEKCLQLYSANNFALVY